VNNIDQYISEIEKDLIINEFNIKDVSMKTPARKHYWVGRLIRHKKNLYNLEKEKTDIKKKVVKELLEQSPIKITIPVAEKASLNHTNIVLINEKINNEMLIIEFLEKTEKIFSSVSFDISNIVKIMQMEQL
tara:strand:- start:1365 stop:1760 length:396 start_codon:yes stop_codon:yes gene_type:complete